MTNFTRIAPGNVTLETGPYLGGTDRAFANQPGLLDGAPEAAVSLAKAAVVLTVAWCPPAWPLAAMYLLAKNR